MDPTTKVILIKQHLSGDTEKAVIRVCEKNRALVDAHFASLKSLAHKAKKQPVK